MIFSTDLLAHFIIPFFIVMALYVFGYHYERNGNPINFGDFASRCFWSLMFGMGYIILCGLSVNWFIVGALIVLQWISITIIPHAFAQNAGLFGRPWVLAADGTTISVKKYWPGAWLPHNFTQAEWTALSLNYKRFLDFMGMATVGLIRGAIVFMPLVALGAPWSLVLPAVAVTTVGLPTSYLLGSFTPWTIWNNTPGAEWGEFYVGIVWDMAVATFAGLVAGALVLTKLAITNPV